MSDTRQRLWNQPLQTLGPFAVALVNYQTPLAKARQKPFVQDISPRGSVPPITLMGGQPWLAMFGAMGSHPNCAIPDKTRVKQCPGCPGKFWTKQHAP